ncbi:MAG: hypothetical protein K6G38_02900 [Gammaproteobacteria bacterium]|nr:hypothetical protein [Gammaproteobacteria bacterium]
MSKSKKILNIVGDVLIGLIIVLAVFGIIYGLSTRSNNGVPKLFGKSAYVVPTTSMNISKSEAEAKGINTKTLIAKGDLVFGDSNVAYTDIEIGDVIFFWGLLSSDAAAPSVIVHRVINIIYTDSGSINYLVTRGDNPDIAEEDVQYIDSQSYIAKYTGKIGKVGHVILFLTTNTWINYTKKDGTENTLLKNLYNFKLPIGFGLLIVLPILVYLIIMIVRLILTISNNKKVDNMNDLAQGVANDDIKEAIIQEYLRKQEELKKAQENGEAKSTDEGGKE